MDNIIRLSRALGFCWCWPKPKIKIGVDIEAFQEKRLPVFWVCGPPCSNRTKIAELLETASGYILVKVSKLIETEVAKMNFRAKIILDYTKQREAVPDDFIIDLIKEHLSLNYENATGFIYSGFPLHVQQAKIFELQVSKVSIIIYCTANRETLIKRMQKKYEGMEESRIKAFLDKSCSDSQKVYRSYENKTLKTRTDNDSLENVTRKIIVDLYKFWGYELENKPIS